MTRPAVNARVWVGGLPGRYRGEVGGRPTVMMDGECWSRLVDPAEMKADVNENRFADMKGGATHAHP